MTLGERVLEVAQRRYLPVTPKVRAFVLALSEDYLRSTLQIARDALDEVLEDDERRPSL